LGQNLHEDHVRLFVCHVIADGPLERRSEFIHRDVSTSVCVRLLELALEADQAVSGQLLVNRYRCPSMDVRTIVAKPRNSET